MANSMRQLYVDSIISFSTWYEKGEKTGVLLKLSDDEQLVEDLIDLAAAAESQLQTSSLVSDVISKDRKLYKYRGSSTLLLSQVQSRNTVAKRRQHVAAQQARRKQEHSHLKQ